MRPSLSIVVLNLGPQDGESLEVARERLAKTIYSLRDQGLDYKDEIIVAQESYLPWARKIWLDSGLSGQFLVPTDHTHGNAMSLAVARHKGDWLGYCRDGDEWTLDAIRHIRTFLEQTAEGTTIMFRNTLAAMDGYHASTVFSRSMNNEIKARHPGIQHDQSGFIILKSYLPPQGTTHESHRAAAS